MKSTLAVIVAILIATPPAECWAEQESGTPDYNFQIQVECNPTNDDPNPGPAPDGCCLDQRDQTKQKCEENNQTQGLNCNVCPPTLSNGSIASLSGQGDGQPPSPAPDAGSGTGSGAGSGSGSGAGSGSGSKNDMMMGIIGGALVGGAVGLAAGMGISQLMNGNKDATTAQSQPVSNVPQKGLPGATQWCPGKASWDTSCGTAEIGPADVGSTASASASGSANATAAAPSGVGSSQAPAVVGSNDSGVQPLKPRGRRSPKRSKAPKTQDI
ncbi:MAG: hypothetical protein NTX64_12725 [Elusimicrobia bacterium]|nr:hypothetical protein [Elusimicrobiota bacterium]